jgi:hypothetical protein
VHDRHFSVEDCKKAGLVIEDLEKDQLIQDTVLSIHHTLMLSFARTRAIKVIDNQIEQHPGYYKMLQ